MTGHSSLTCCSWCGSCKRSTPHLAQQNQNSSTAGKRQPHLNQTSMRKLEIDRHNIAAVVRFSNLFWLPYLVTSISRPAAAAIITDSALQVTLQVMAPAPRAGAPSMHVSASNLCAVYFPFADGLCCTHCLTWPKVM